MFKLPISALNANSILATSSRPFSSHIARLEPSNTPGLSGKSLPSHIALILPATSACSQPLARNSASAGALLTGALSGSAHNPATTLSKSQSFFTQHHHSLGIPVCAFDALVSCDQDHPVIFALLFGAPAVELSRPQGLPELLAPDPTAAAPRPPISSALSGVKVTVVCSSLHHHLLLRPDRWF